MAADNAEEPPGRDREKAVEAWIAGGILFGALAIRIAAWAFWRSSPFYRQPILDAAFYHNLATGALQAPEGPYLWNPFYPVFLKVVYWIGGKGPDVPVLFQMGLGALGAEFAYLTARRIFPGRATAIGCGILAALYAPFLFYEGLLLGAAPAVFFVWLFLWLSARAESKSSPAWWLLPGLVLGTAGLIRPTLLVSVPLLAAWLIWRNRSGPLARRILPGALFVLAAFLPLLPSFLHNLRFGAVHPVALHGGVNFYIGNRKGAGGGYERPFPGPHGLWGQRLASRREAERRTERTLTWSEADRFWFREGLREGIREPGAWGALSAKKILLLFNAYEIPLDYNYDFHRGQSPLLSFPLPHFSLLVPFAVAGLFLLAANRRVPWAAVLFFAAGALGTVLFFVTSRYRLPLVPPLVLLAGFGAVEGVRTLFSARLTRFALAAALGAAAAVPVFLPVPRSDFSGSWRLLGDVHRKDGRLAEAIRAYDASIRIAPSSAAWNNKGTTILMLEGRRGAEDSAKAFREAIRLEEGNREAWNNLGVALKRSGDLLGAEDAFEEAIRRFPWYEKPVVNLARMYDEHGDPEAARDLIENLAGLYEKRRDLEDAGALRRRWKHRRK